MAALVTGKIKTIIAIVCERCGTLFDRERKWVNLNFKRGTKNFCSEACRAQYRRLVSESSKIKMLCAAGCGKHIYRTQHQLKTRSNVFCSRSCANRVRKGKDHPNFKTGHSTYRQRALEHHGASCTICGYAVEVVLEVHHRDGNRTNNVIDNLDVLCPTHHTEYQLGIRFYE